MNQSKKIGVFVSHIYGEYQNKLCTGIIRKAQEYGYRVEIFASNDGENLGDYGNGERSILRIPRPDSYSGFILASGTYLLKELEQEIATLLKEQFTCPVIDINQTDCAFPRIALENHKPIGELVGHLTDVHKYKRICYLGNSVEELFSRKRQEAYQNSMASHGLPIEEAFCYTCDYSREGTLEAINYFLSLPERPEAIVCYNDRMALSLISELKNMKYHIPEDIAVTGCDTLEFGQNTRPVLTSVTFPIDTMGEMAVTQLIHALHGEDIPAVTTVTADPCIGTSCGCPDKIKAFPYAYSRLLSSRIDTLEKNLILNMHMSANLQGVADIDQGMDLLEQFALDLPGCRELYICLYEDWNEVSGHIREITFTEDEELDSDCILLKLALKEGKRLPECTFTKRNILPDFLYDPATTAYVFAPLFFRDKEFGYVVLSYYDNRLSYSFPFISWLMNVNSMLKNLCDTKNMGLLVGRLEDIYTTDELTGLYNRQGFRIRSAPLIQRAITEQKPLMAILWDLDCLKVINDTFGHTEGNFAIQVLAHALENSSPEDVVCSRLGGDEFQVLGLDYTPEQAAALIEKVHKYLDNYNKLHTKNYYIQASGGFHIQKIFHSDYVQDLFDKADKNMYAEKNAKQKNVVRQD